MKGLPYLGSYRIATAPEPNSSRLTSFKSIRFISHPAKKESIGPVEVLDRVTMQVFVRDAGPMIAAPVQGDVDGIPKGSHYSLFLDFGARFDFALRFDSAFGWTRSGNSAFPASRFHFSKVSGEILPFISNSANFLRCALLLIGIKDLAVQRRGPRSIAAIDFAWFRRLA